MLHFTGFYLLAEEDKLNFALRKKINAMQDPDTYKHIRNSTIKPFITIFMEVLDMKLDNTLIATHDEIIAALQEIDKFPPPPASFFKILMAHDILTEIKNITLQIRDYPFYIFTLKHLTAKARSVLTRNRLPLPFWATIKNHYKAEAEIDGGSATLGICLAPILKDIINVINRILVTRDPNSALNLETKTVKPNIVDRYRYFLHGSASATIKN